MRNLKKVLSLALAMVMLLGMMVVGAGAATEFKDADSIDDNRKVAAAVASTIEVLVGDENGNFNPDGTLTRAEAAVVLARLDLGASAASALTATDAATFDDIGAGTGYGWAKPFIDYCYGNGYMVGVGGNSFAPGRTLTGVEFATMVSRVLGYRDENEYGQEGWSTVKAAALARKAGLGTDVAVDSNKMFRADMAQMVLNALTAPMVEYTGLNISGDGFNVSSPASVRTHANDAGGGLDYKGDAIQPNITPIRLCEEKFPELKFAREVEDDTFGRTQTMWKYKGLAIADTVKNVDSNYSFTSETSEDDVRAKIGKTTAKIELADLYVNGKLSTSAGTPAAIAALTHDGRLVEVYLNPKDLTDVDRIVVIDTVPGQVTKVSTEGDVTIKLLSGNADAVEKNDLVTAKADVVDGEFKRDDLVLVQGYDTKSVKLNEKTTVSRVFAPTKLEEFVVRKNWDRDGKPVSVDTESTKGYKDSWNFLEDNGVAKFEVNNKGQDSVLYLDEYNFIIKIEGAKDTSPKDPLIAVADYFDTLENNKIVHKVTGVVSNGETVTLEYKGDTAPTIGKIYTYDKTTKTLDLLTNTDGTYHYGNTNNSAKIAFNANDVKAKGEAAGKFYADTVKFIFADEKNKEVTVRNGRQSYDFEGKVIAQAVDSRGEVIAVFLECTPDFINLDDIIFVWKQKSKDEVVGEDKDTIYYGYYAYNSDTTEIEDFLGTDGDMHGPEGNGQFHKKDTVKKGDITAYKPSTDSNKLKAHTMAPAVITKANGERGDSFTIGGIDYITSSRTKVLDLATKGAITTPAELNQTMIRDKQAVEVALIYTYDSDSETYDVHTIFVTKVDKVGTYDPDKVNQYTVNYTVDGVANSEKVDEGKDWKYAVPATDGDKVINTVKINGVNKGVISSDGKSVTVPEADAKSGTIVITLKAAPVVTEPDIDANIVPALKLVVGGNEIPVGNAKISKASFVPAANPAGTDDGKLVVEVTGLPEGYTLTSIDVNKIVNSIRSAVAGSGTAPWKSSAAQKSNFTTPTDVEVVVTLTAKTDAEVQFSGWTLDGTTPTDNTDDVSTSVAEVIKFKLADVPAYMADTKITYTLTGTSKDGSYTVTTATAGVVLGNETDGPGTVTAKSATTPVQVKIDKVEAANIAASAAKGTGVTETPAFVGSVSKLAADAKELPAVEFTCNNVLKGQKVTVSWKIEGIATGTTTGSKEYTVGAADGKVTVAAADLGAVTLKGTEAVKVTITGVEYQAIKGTNNDVNASGEILKGTPGTIGAKTATASITSGTPAGTVALKKTADGYVNKDDITVTLSAGADPNADKFTAGGSVMVIANGQVLDTVSVTNTNTIDVTIDAEALSIVPGTAITLTFVPQT